MRRLRATVTGEVTPLRGTSRYSLYKADLATYGQGDTFDHTAATGFITIWGLPLQVASAVRAKGKAKKAKR